MVKVSANEKTAIANEVQTEISNLTALNTKIQADTDLTTLKTDIQSITEDYRIFMLVIPQGRIEVAADKDPNGRFRLHDSRHRQTAGA